MLRSRSDREKEGIKKKREGQEKREKRERWKERRESELKISRNNI